MWIIQNYTVNNVGLYNDNIYLHEYWVYTVNKLTVNKSINYSCGRPSSKLYKYNDFDDALEAYKTHHFIYNIEQHFAVLLYTIGLRIKII